MPLLRPTVTAVATASIMWALAAPWPTPATAQDGGEGGGSGAPTEVYGHTPSGNITCRAQQHGSPGWNLVCSAKVPGRTARISTRGRAYKSRYQRIAKRGTELSYGGRFNLGPYGCTSSKRKGLYCSIELEGGDTAGFHISRAGVEIF